MNDNFSDVFWRESEKINGINVYFLIDSGAAHTIISNKAIEI